MISPLVADTALLQNWRNALEVLVCEVIDNEAARHGAGLSPEERRDAVADILDGRLRTATDIDVD